MHPPSGRAVRHCRTSGLDVQQGPGVCRGMEVLGCEGWSCWRKNLQALGDEQSLRPDSASRSSQPGLAGPSIQD